MEYLSLLPVDFATGLLVGLALGLFSRFAVRVLAYAAIVFVAFELIRASGAL